MKDEITSDRSRPLLHLRKKGLFKMLRESRYYTDVEELISFIKRSQYRDLATLMTFKSIATVAPCIPYEQRKRLYDFLAGDIQDVVKESDDDDDDSQETRVKLKVHASNIWEIPAFSVLGASVSIPHIEYPNLTDATVDIYNIEQIMRLFRDGKLPKFNSLTLYHWNLIDLGPMAAKIVKLNLQGISTGTKKRDIGEFEIFQGFHELPLLQELYLSRYNVRLNQALPRIIHLEQCRIESFNPDNNKKKPNEIFTLIECSFREQWPLRGTYPSKILRLQRNLGMQPFNFSDVPRLAIEEITVIDQDILNPSLMEETFEGYDKLKTLRVEGAVHSINPRYFRTLENLVINWDNGFGNTRELPPTLKQLTIIDGEIEEDSVATKEEVQAEQDRIKEELSLGIETIGVQKGQRMVFPDNLITLDFDNVKLDMTGFFRKLPATLKKIRFYNSVLLGDAEVSELPEPVEEFKCIDCISPIFKITMDSFNDNVQTVHILGYYEDTGDDINRFHKLEIVRPIVRAFKELRMGNTDVALMSFVNFRFFCVDKSREELFKDYEECYRDVVARADNGEPEFFDVFIKTPFVIPLSANYASLYHIFEELVTNGEDDDRDDDQGYEGTNRHTAFKRGNTEYTIQMIRNKGAAMRRKETNNNEVIDEVLGHYLNLWIYGDAGEAEEGQEIEEEASESDDEDRLEIASD